MHPSISSSALCFDRTFVDAGLRDDVVIMVGGAPVTDNHRMKAGADLYAEDAATAAELAKEAILKKKGV